MRFGTALPGPVLARCFWPSIAVPFIEEAFFRGIVLGVLLRTGRKYMAIFAVSAIFAAVHFLKAPERTSEIVTWTSGFSSIAHAFDGIGDPTMVALALATLFFIGWILADARVLTHSLWLSIGLHAGWIFGSGAFSQAGTSANARLSLDRKEHAGWNYPAWSSCPHLDNNAHVAEI